MKSILMGTGLMVVMALAAWIITDTQSESTSMANASKNNSVRLDN